MGSWPFMGAATVFLVIWMASGAFGFDKSPFFKLNLLLSCFAALQGAILLIAAKRADQVSSEVAVHTEGNTDQLVDLLRQNTALTGEIHKLQTAANAMLGGLEHVNAELNAIRAAVAPGVPNPAAGTDTAPARPAAKGRPA